MQFQLLRNRPGTWAVVSCLLLVFALAETWMYRHADGEDLASSYVGSRLLIEHLPEHLFSYDRQSFAEIGEDDTWTEVAQRRGFWGYLHPYVQTPLWAWVLEPICRHLYFPDFNKLFAFVTMLTFAATIFLVARFWAPSFFNPYAIVVVILLLALSQPFQYAMFLNQTHMLFVFLTVVALMLAEREWPWLAGFLLACAAAVKVTPVLLILYWVMNRRWKAAASAALWSAALWAAPYLLFPHALMATYLADLGRISRTLLVSQNNQSLAAWWMARFYPPDAVWDIDIYPLPPVLRLLSTGLIVVLTAWGGWLDWQRRRAAGGRIVAPLGAMAAVLAATIFAPIAWTHYAIVLLMPAMMLGDALHRLRRPWLWSLLAAALLLNYAPFATDIVHGEIGDWSVVRGQFFSCLLTMIFLLIVASLQMGGKFAGLQRRAMHEAHA